MTTKKKTTATTLKVKLNPKNRGNIVELARLDPKELTAREKIMMRVINSLEEQLDSVKKASE